MIVDFHCHAGTGDRLTSPWTTRAPLSSYLRRAAAAGIQRTVVLPAGHNDYAAANEELARIVAQHRPRLIGFGGVHAEQDAGRVQEILLRAVELGFRGVKVHCADARPTREVCDAARDLGLPVLMDVTGKPSVIDLVAPEYPMVIFIIAHLGSFVDDWRAQQQVVDQLVRYANVYADTSGVRRFDYLLQAIRRAGAGKLLFGSDGPWLHPAVELHKIRMLKLPIEAESLVAGGNALRILKKASLVSEKSAHRAAAWR